MALSDVVARNLTTLYLMVIAVVKISGLTSGRSYAGGFVLVISTVVVLAILIAALTWDVSRKATYLLTRDYEDKDHDHHVCRGGICWHGVAVRSPASQLRFRLLQRDQAHNNPLI
ncbi:Endoplasmin protein [Heracleum sosnowskyi]|uniref:Endoplasmin protein n=1 Tax=Heracleum sosnowskyi TaxID=360622 RepID=A0AAD8H9L1_9APIA|nr:Endoplasmin protein [Heracleum sosnowskyi]